MLFRRRPSRSSAPVSNTPAAQHHQHKLSPHKRHGIKRINECIEQLETRRLLTTLRSTAGIPTTFEYVDASNNTNRITMQGNIVAEFIAAEVDDNSKTGGTLPHIKLRPRDLVVSRMSQSDGYDLFEIYIQQADINSSIAIARVPAPGTDDRPMQPFGSSAGEFRITNASTGRSETVDPGSSTGGSFLGARTGDTIPNTSLEEDFSIPNIPFRRNWGVRPAASNGKFYAGLIVAPGVNLGQFLFGGTVTGRVSIGGNMNLFYCGALWTGDATGIFSTQASTSPRNFSVAGDLRNLITIGSIGTVDLPDATANPAAMQFKSGVDIRVSGRLGQIVTKNAWLGAVTVEGNPNVRGTGLAQQEIEVRRDPAPTNSQSFFEGFPFDFNPQLNAPSLGDNPIFNNDSPDTAQYLGTFRSASLKQDDAIELEGVLNGDSTDVPSTGAARDDVDYYAVALMGGQRVDVQLTAVNPVPSALNATDLDLIHVAVFDPDNRIIATDYNNNGQASRGHFDQNTSKTDFTNPAFRFVAQRPGIYKFAIANESDTNFNGITDERSVVFYPGSFHQYRLALTHTANIALGGLIATNSVAFTDSSGSSGLGATTPSLDVLNGDVGAIISTSAGSADTLIFSDGPTMTGVPFTNPWRIRKGNLRTVMAPSIGISDNSAAGSGNPLLTLSFIIPKGSVGLLRTTGTGDQQTLAVNNDLVNTITGEFDPSVIVGVDYQTIDAASSFVGNLMAGRGIGTIRADIMSAHDTPCRIAVNADNRNSDGFIDLINVRTQMGTLNAGGPQITTGDNGNVRYIVTPTGGMFRDRFFGGGQIQPTTFNPGQVVNLTDDSGTAVKITPGPQLINSAGDVLNPTTLNITTFPIRDKGGSVIVNVTQLPATIVNPVDGSVTVGGNQSLTIDTGSAGRGGTAEIGTINILSPGTIFDFNQFARVVAPLVPADAAANPNVNNDIILSGKAVLDVWNINCSGVTGTGLTGLTLVNNKTVGGEVANIQAAHIGEIDADYVGIPKSHSGAAVEGVDILIDGLPFNQQRVLINAAGAPGYIGLINARRQVGNVHASTIGTINANSDRSDVKGLFEGIVAPIWAQNAGVDPKQGNLVSVNIGEGLASGGSSSSMFAAGLFADGLIDGVRNQGVNSDIHGPVIALRHTTDFDGTITNPDGTTSNVRTPLTGIGSIRLTNGAILDSDVMVVSSYDDALETAGIFVVQGAPAFSTFGTPISNIGGIEISGIGGILGSVIIADNLGPVSIKGGFGFIASEIQSGGNSTTTGIDTDGFGIRYSTIDAGAAMNFAVARGEGKRLSVTEYTGTARFSERNVFDPFSGRLLDPYNDLHKFFGTSKSNPKRKGKTEAGVIADTTISGGRTATRIEAYRIVGDPQIIDPVTGGQAMRISFGNLITKIFSHDVVDGLLVTAGGINTFQTGNDVSALSLTSAGDVKNIIIGGNLKSNSTIRATGADGRIDNLSTKRALLGRVNASVKLGNVTTGTDLGSRDLSSSNDIGILTVNGSVLSGANIRARDTIEALNIGRNIQDGATITARRINSQHIKGQVFGDVIITG